MELLSTNKNVILYCWVVPLSSTFCEKHTIWWGEPSVTYSSSKNPY